MKKLLSVLLCIALMSSLAIGASSVSSDEIRFNENGEFRILQISDTQDDHHPADEMLNFIKLSIEKSKPDLIIFTGDVVEDFRVTDNASDDQPLVDGVIARNAALKVDVEKTKENVATAFDAVFSMVNSYNIPFAIALGNNDYKVYMEKEDWLELFAKYENCITVDESTDSSDRIDHNIEIKGSTGGTVFNLWVMDTAKSAVTEEQLEWYVSESNALKEKNGGNPVPSMVFQHIPVSEVGYLFEECNAWDYGAVFSGKKAYRLNPEMASGYCTFLAGSGDSEQFKAWQKQGDVLGAYFGHWHTEGYTGTYNGIELGLTYGAEFAKNPNYGYRVITLHENDIENYENELYVYTGSYRKGTADFELQQTEAKATPEILTERVAVLIQNIIRFLKGALAI